MNELNKSRLLSDAEAVKNGASVDNAGKVIFTPKQIEIARNEMRYEKDEIYRNKVDLLDSCEELKEQISYQVRKFITPGLHFEKGESSWSKLDDDSIKFQLEKLDELSRKIFEILSDDKDQPHTSFGLQLSYYKDLMKDHSYSKCEQVGEDIITYLSGLMDGTSLFK